MSDPLGEALAQAKANWALVTLEQRDDIVAAARSWHTLTTSEPRQLWSWNQSGKRRVMEPGKFYVVPVDALTDTAEPDGG